MNSNIEPEGDVADSMHGQGEGAFSWQILMHMDDISSYPFWRWVL